MKFYMGYIKGRFGIGKKQSKHFSAKDAEEARKIAPNIIPGLDKFFLYQFLEPGENGQGNLPGYRMVWLWEQGRWSRVVGGQKFDLSIAPDNITDKEIVDKYLPVRKRR